MSATAKNESENDGGKPIHVATLEQLATKRRHATAAIVGLCQLYNIDAAPYLADAHEVRVSLEPVKLHLNIPKALTEKPPRPPRPASPQTKGVDGHKAKVLELLNNGPMSPSELTKKLGFNDVTALRYHTRQLEKDGLVKSTGGPNNRMLALT